MTISSAPNSLPIERLRIARRLPSPARARAIRLAAGATQPELAARVGCDRVTVARWEAGVRTPRGELRAAYALALEELARLLTDPTNGNAPVGSGGVANTSGGALGDVHPV